MSEILTGDNCVKFDAEGKAPKVTACWACALDLCSNHPQMPRMALAKDNLMLREPCVFHDGSGNPLSDATLLLLALARAVVVKEVPEPLRQVPAAEQQQVFKGNTIALSQADCRVLATVIPMGSQMGTNREHDFVTPPTRKKRTHTHTIHVWYSYLHLLVVYGQCRQNLPIPWMRHWDMIV